MVPQRPPDRCLEACALPVHSGAPAPIPEHPRGYSWSTGIYSWAWYRYPKSIPGALDCIPGCGICIPDSCISIPAGALRKMYSIPTPDLYSWECQKYSWTRQKYSWDVKNYSWTPKSIPEIPKSIPELRKSIPGGGISIPDHEKTIPVWPLGEMYSIPIPGIEKRPSWAEIQIPIPIPGSQE